MKTLLSILLLAFMQVSLLAELQISSLFQDGAVFQQNAKIPVWGWAPAGTRVSLSFKGQTKSGSTDSSGKWMLYLDAVKASDKGAEMTITVGSESKTIKDILVGEVWVCGGQSNMEWRLNMLTGKAREPQYEPLAEYAKKEIATANDPLIRQIKVARKVSALEEQDNFNGAWEKAVPNVVGNFTATGYFFAKELRAKLNVPVGLVNCNWGGTRVEPWIPMSKFQTTESLKSYYDQEIGNMKAQMAKWDPEKVNQRHTKQLAEWKRKPKKQRKLVKKLLVNLVNHLSLTWQIEFLQHFTMA